MNDVEIHHRKIVNHLYELARELENMDKERRGRAWFWPSLALRRRSCEWQNAFVHTLHRRFSER
jgi:hypothetical protein